MTLKGIILEALAGKDEEGEKRETGIGWGKGLTERILCTYFHFVNFLSNASRTRIFFIHFLEHGLSFKHYNMLT